MPENPIVYAHPDKGQAVKAVRYDRLQLPLHICLGHYEAATQEELHDLIADLTHEAQRRSP